MMAEFHAKTTDAKAAPERQGTELEKPVYDPTAPSAIEVDHIVKKYGDFTAVDDVSFSVKEGEIFGLLGPNGAGKSTLIRMMTTLIPITSGKARIAGHDVAKEPNAARRMIGVIPQALTSDLDLTIEENMSIYAKLYDVPAKERKKSIDELLELVDLTKWRDAATKTLSGGMRRRLEIARGLVHHPSIFFLDEPTTGLDPVSRVAVWEMLGNIKEHRKLTILITTHYMDEADRLCDRIAIVDHGKLVALDAPMALKASVPGSNVIEAQFENPPADWEQRLAHARRSHLGAARRRRYVSRAHRQWLAHHHRTGRDGGYLGRAGEVALGAEYDARRRLRALHRKTAARRIAESLCLRHAAAAGFAAVKASLVVRRWSLANRFFSQRPTTNDGARGSELETQD